MLSNITLPTLEEIRDKNNAEKIRGYLATLHDQLKYMMLNIDTDNLSDTLNTTISTSSQGVTDLKESVIQLDESMSVLSQAADKISWIVSDGTSSTDFSFTPYATELISKCVDITGYVTFSDLESNGKTVINGSNIISGSISADKLTVNDLSALSANIGGWSLSSSAIQSKSQSGGALSLNSATSSDPYWIKATDSYGYTTFYIAKSGACYFNGGYISSGSISADKIVCDTEKRLDLTNNYNGIKIGSGMVVTNGYNNCRLFVNNSGILTFDTGTGDSMFSLALLRSGSSYTLSVLNGSGQSVGSIPLS